MRIDCPTQMLSFSVAIALDFGDFVISINGPDELIFTVCIHSAHVDLAIDELASAV